MFQGHFLNGNFKYLLIRIEMKINHWTALHVPIDCQHVPLSEDSNWNDNKFS